MVFALWWLALASVLYADRPPSEAIRHPFKSCVDLYTITEDPDHGMAAM
jgi:hypothetical protein